MTKPPHDATSLAADRTRLALERTLMAWIRTCTSLIAFGFAIYQFFHFLRESAETQARQRLITPQVVAILMILVGLTALILAWIQHRQQMKALQTQFGAMPRSLAGVIACLIAGLGVVALLAVLLGL